MITVIEGLSDSEKKQELFYALEDYFNSHKQEYIKTVESLDEISNNEFLDGWGPGAEYLGYGLMSDFKSSVPKDERDFWLDPENMNPDYHFDINDKYVRLNSDGIESAATDEDKYYYYFILDALVEELWKIYTDDSIWCDSLDEIYLPETVRDYFVQYGRGN